MGVMGTGRRGLGARAREGERKTVRKRVVGLKEMADPPFFSAR